MGGSPDRAGAPWSDEAVRRSFAEMVVAGLEGAFILSRARQSGTPFITVGEWLATMYSNSFHGTPGAVLLESQCAGGTDSQAAAIGEVSHAHSRTGHLELFRVRQS